MGIDDGVVDVNLYLQLTIAMANHDNGGDSGETI